MRQLYPLRRRQFGSRSHTPCTIQELGAFEAAARARLKDDIYTYSRVTLTVGMGIRIGVGIGVGVEVGDSSYCCRLAGWPVDQFPFPFPLPPLPIVC